MNNLLSRSFNRSIADDSSQPHSHSIEMTKAKNSGGSCDSGINLDKFYHDVEEVNKNLKELDMAVLVVHQGEQLDDIEGNVKNELARLFGPVLTVLSRGGYQKNTCNWICFAVLLLTIMVVCWGVLLLVFAFKRYEISNDGGDGGSPPQASVAQDHPFLVVAVVVLIVVFFVKHFVMVYVAIQEKSTLLARESL